MHRFQSFLAGILMTISIGFSAEAHTHLALHITDGSTKYISVVDDLKISLEASVLNISSDETYTNFAIEDIKGISYLTPSSSAITRPSDLTTDITVTPLGILITKSGSNVLHVINVNGRIIKSNTFSGSTTLTNDSLIPGVNIIVVNNNVVIKLLKK